MFAVLDAWPAGPARPGRGLREVLDSSRIRRRAACLLPALVVLPKFVVLAPFLGVAQDLVRLVDFLEARFGGLVAGIQIGMILARQPPISFLDLFLVRVLLNTQNLVVVLILHADSPLGLDGKG